MKILLLGTSNCILKHGWVSGLRRALPTAEIVNMSIGGSPGEQFGCHLNDGLEAYDLIFFDSVINDENLASYIGSEAFSDRIIYEIMSTISAKAPTIVLGFSNEKYLNNHSKVYERRRALAVLCGVQFVGMHELLEKYGRQLAPDSTALFDKGGLHPLNEVQALFGYELGKLLLSQGDLVQRMPGNIDFSSLFSIEKATDLAPPERLTIKKSAIKTRAFLDMGPDASLKFSSAGLCLGFYINASETQALVALDGPRERRLKELWYDPEDSLRIKFMPVHNGMPVQSITMLNPADYPVDTPGIERSQHSVFIRRYPQGSVKLAFDTALFWSGQETDPVPSGPADAENSLVLHRLVEAAVEDHLANAPETAAASS